MGLHFASQQSSGYTVATPLYEGPLDLLLHLIERAELDITKLALAQVTDQYLAYLRNLPELAAEEVSVFLVIAARLLQIKSEVLLPRPPAREPGEEDPGEALARQLVAYKRFKKIALFLDERQSAGLRTFLRVASPPKVEGQVDLTGLDLSDLAAAARSVLAARADLLPSLDSVITAPTVTIRQMINLIAGLLRRSGRANFRTLLSGARNRLDIVVTFLAILELVKLRFVTVSQDRLFGEIEVEAAETWESGAEFELEFGE
jgi:segregation and condensation protein A